MVGELVNIVGLGGFEGYYNDEVVEVEWMVGGVYYSGDFVYCDDVGYVYFVGWFGDWM